MNFSSKNKKPSSFKKTTMNILNKDIYENFNKYNPVKNANISEIKIFPVEKSKSPIKRYRSISLKKKNENNSFNENFEKYVFIKNPYLKKKNEKKEILQNENFFESKKNKFNENFNKFSFGENPFIIKKSETVKNLGKFQYENFERDFKQNGALKRIWEKNENFETFENNNISKDKNYFSNFEKKRYFYNKKENSVLEKKNDLNFEKNRLKELASKLEMNFEKKHKLLNSIDLLFEKKANLEKLNLRFENINRQKFVINKDICLIKRNVENLKDNKIFLEKMNYYDFELGKNNL